MIVAEGCGQSRHPLKENFWLHHSGGHQSSPGNQPTVQSMLQLKKLTRPTDRMKHRILKRARGHPLRFGFGATRWPAGCLADAAEPYIPHTHRKASENPPMSTRLPATIAYTSEEASHAHRQTRCATPASPHAASAAPRGLQNTRMFLPPGKCAQASVKQQLKCPRGIGLYHGTTNGS